MESHASDRLSASPQAGALRTNRLGSRKGVVKCSDILRQAENYCLPHLHQENKQRGSEIYANLGDLAGQAALSSRRLHPRAACIAGWRMDEAGASQIITGKSHLCASQRTVSRCRISGDSDVLWSSGFNDTRKFYYSENISVKQRMV